MIEEILCYELYGWKALILFIGILLGVFIDQKIIR